MNNLPVVAFRCREVFFFGTGGRCLELIVFSDFVFADVVCFLSWSEFPLPDHHLNHFLGTPTIRKAKGLKFFWVKPMSFLDNPRDHEHVG